MTNKEIKQLLREVCADLENEKSDNAEKSQGACPINLNLLAALETIAAGNTDADGMVRIAAEALSKADGRVE